jgi:hypothetical protein
MDGRPTLSRRRFLVWSAKAAAAVSALVGSVVGFEPLALAVRNCIPGTKYPVSGSCTAPGAGICVSPGGWSCVDVCHGNNQCYYNSWLQPIRIKCTCSPPECCAQWC